MKSLPMILENLREDLDGLLEMEVLGDIEHTYEIMNTADGDYCIRFKARGIEAEFLDDLRVKIMRELGVHVDFHLEIELHFFDEALEKYAKEMIE